MLIPLNHQDLLQGLPADVLSALDSRAHVKTFAPGDILIHEGDVSDTIHFIAKGVVAVFRMDEGGRIIPLTLLHAGQSIGEMGVITQNARSATVEAVSFVETYEVSKDDFNLALKANSQLAEKLLHELSNRLLHESEVVQMQKTNSIASKALNVLQELAPYFPGSKISISQEKLAQLVGATRPRLTEALHNLEKSGHITLGFRSIQL